jgi:ankyrin repeat protein
MASGQTQARQTERTLVQASILRFASREGYLSIVRRELESSGGLNVDTADRSGLTAWHHAACAGHVPILRCLDKDGHANTAAVTVHGYTGLHLAVTHNHLDAVQYMRTCTDISVQCTTADNSMTVLHLAAATGSLQMLQYLYETGLLHGVVNQQETRHGRTALCVAAYHGYKQIVRYLYKTCGADINVQSYDGATPIITATDAGHVDVVVYLSRRKGVKVQERAMPMVPGIRYNRQHFEALVASFERCVPCHRPACEVRGMRRCARCNVVKYCSAKCQGIDWAERHQALCVSGAPQRYQNQKQDETSLPANKTIMVMTHKSVQSWTL